MEDIMGDPEIDAMSAVAGALVSLDERAQRRVLRWAAERYGVTVSTHGHPGSAVDGETGSGAHEEVTDVTEEVMTEDDPQFEDFAELFASADPKSHEDRALVAAYWRHVHEGEESWQSSALQADLRNLGHSIPNITTALTSNMRKRPQRVIQLKKAGSAKQARKTYKLTRAGVVYVQGMLGHGG